MDLPTPGVASARVAQPRPGPNPTGPRRVGILFALNPVFLVQALLEFFQLGTLAGLGPTLGGPLGPLNHAVLLGLAWVIADQSDPQPDQPQFKNRGEPSRRAPRAAVIHAQM